MSETLKWTTQKRKIKELIPYEQNPRQMTEKQKKDLEKSIKKFDLVEIPAIDTKNRIVAGHQRLKILSLMGRGEEEIDVRVPTRELTEEEFKEYNLRSNKNTGEFDWDMLANSFDLEMLKDVGFDSEELDKIMGFEEPNEKDDEVPEVPEEPKAKLGDIYQIGNHRVVCGDSTKVEDVEKLMDGVKADMVFTDPPYGIGYKDTKGKHSKIEGDESLDNIQSLITTTLLNTCPMFICCNWKSYSAFEKAMIEVDKEPKSCIVWDKETRIQNLDRFYKQHEFILYYGLFGGQKTITGDVWRVNRQTRRDHPTAKPVELITNAINYTILPEQIVQDLFLGSGSTLIACEKTNRICYGMELDPKYIDVIIQRYCDYVEDNKIIKNGEEIIWERNNTI